MLLMSTREVYPPESVPHVRRSIPTPCYQIYTQNWLLYSSHLHPLGYWSLFNTDFPKSGVSSTSCGRTSTTSWLFAMYIPIEALMDRISCPRVEFMEVSGMSR